MSTCEHAKTAPSAHVQGQYWAGNDGQLVSGHVQHDHRQALYPATATQDLYIRLPGGGCWLLGSRPTLMEVQVLGSPVRQEEVCAVHHEPDSEDWGASDKARGEVDGAGGEEGPQGKV